MNIRIHWFCFILLAKTLLIASYEDKDFLSCTNFFDDDFFVTFNSEFLDANVFHRNYFDNNVIDTTCKSKYSDTVKRVSLANDVTLKNCRIPIIPHDFLQRLEHIQKINLDKSGIKAINSETFPNTSTLEKISMQMNELTALPGFLFSQTSNISQIDLSYNRISIIDPNTFRRTTQKLKIVNLSHNNIETLDKLLFTDLIKLTELNLGHNFIEHFQIDLSKLKDLTVLRLDNNNIVRLDCTIFDLTTNKIEINVNHNHIWKIDLNCDAHLESLELNINDNQLTSLTFPKSNLLNGLTNMQASRNHIENVTFQQSIRQLTALSLNSNNLKDLFEWDETMFPKLKYLNICRNQFNCTYLSIFLKKVPKTLRLECIETDRDFANLVSSKTSKFIHGINCNDDMKKYSQSDHADDVVHAITWCLLAFLSVGVVIFFIYCVYKNRSRLLMCLKRPRSSRSLKAEFVEAEHHIDI